MLIRLCQATPTYRLARRGTMAVIVALAGASGWIPLLIKLWRDRQDKDVRILEGKLCRYCHDELARGKELYQFISFLATLPARNPEPKPSPWPTSTSTQDRSSGRTTRQKR